MSPIRLESEDSNFKGMTFEQRIFRILRSFQSLCPERLVSLTHQPRIRLVTGEFRVPDFQLIVERGATRDWWLIECQDRKKSSNAILEKLSHIRQFGRQGAGDTLPTTKFLFVHGHALSDAFRQQMRASVGAHCMDPGELELWLRTLIVDVKPVKPPSINSSSPIPYP